MPVLFGICNASHLASALTLNLLEFAASKENFSGVLVGEKMKDGGIALDPSWLSSAWMLGHPYEADIFNLDWNPAVFISQGPGSLSVIDVKFSSHLGVGGAFRNF